MPQTRTILSSFLFFALSLTAGCGVSKLGTAEEKLAATMNNDAMNPPAALPGTGSGTATVTVRPGRDGADFAVSYRGLLFAPIYLTVYRGAAGTAGTPVLRGAGLSGTGLASSSGEISGSFDATRILDTAGGATIGDLLQEMMSGNTYLVISTTGNAAGEIRGQLRQQE